MLAVRKKIAVVGAGTVGLSVALRLKEQFPNDVDVTVIAAEFLQQTTSYSSGGLWEPYQIAGTSDAQVNEWGQYAFEHFKQLYHSPDAAAAGVQLLNAYTLLEADDNTPDPSWKDIVFNFKNLSQADVQKMGLPRNFVRGFQFSTFVIDQKYYMKYLTRSLETLGVRFEQRRLSSLQELDGAQYDLIVNCTGLGSAQLLNDKDMYPIRGQVLRVRAPWVKDIWFWGSSYMIPNVDTVVLGGTADKGNWSTTVSLDDTKKILDNIAKVFPSIHDAPIESVWVGLRPGRSPLRIESEVTTSLRPVPTPIVHCYGHGGSGITLAMGCAQDVTMNHVHGLLQLPTLSRAHRPAYEEFRPRSKL